MNFMILMNLNFMNLINFMIYVFLKNKRIFEEIYFIHIYFVDMWT